MCLFAQHRIFTSGCSVVVVLILSSSNLDINPSRPTCETSPEAILLCFVCLFGIASPQVGLPGPFDFVDRSLTAGKNQCIS